MSAKRIDQAKEARRLLALLPASMHEDEVIGKAQVHATLALVEQQRIANLIALVGVPEQYGSSSFKDLLWVDGRLRPDIREALGLS